MGKFDSLRKMIVNSKTGSAISRELILEKINDACDWGELDIEEFNELMRLLNENKEN